MRAAVVPLGRRSTRAYSERPPRTLSGNRRGGRDLHSRILQGPMVRSAATGLESGAGRPGIRAFIRTMSRSSSPATGRARPSTPSCLRLMALLSAPRSPASSRRAIISSAMAERRSPLLREERGSPFANACPGRRHFVRSIGLERSAIWWNRPFAMERSVCSGNFSSVPQRFQWVRTRFSSVR